MSKEPRDGGADVAAVFHAGRSGEYPSPYLTGDDLLALSALCVDADRVICTVEAFEISGEYDLARTDLSLYGETADQKQKSWPVRAAESHRFIVNLVVVTRLEANPVMFGVWLDWSDEVETRPPT